MGATYTTATLAQQIAELQAAVNNLSQTVSGTPEATDALAAGDAVVSVGKTLDAQIAAIRKLAKSLKRTARIILMLDDLGRATGETAPLAAFLAACSAADLDYLVALRQGKCDTGWLHEFYLKCRTRALESDADSVVPKSVRGPPTTQAHIGHPFRCR